MELPTTDGHTAHEEGAKDSTHQGHNLDRLVKAFVLERSTTFRELNDIRIKGWNNKEGDAFFQNQRRSADTADSRAKTFFFQMMQNIGREMDQKTGVFSSVGRLRIQPKFLDLCMAPGGFSQFLIDLHPHSEVCGISLPVSSGGHKILLNTEDPRVNIQFLDITMLASEMLSSKEDLLKIPQDHPDAGNFRSDRPYLNATFDCVICDGQVLRTHERSEYRESVEAARLFMSQLVIGLSRIRPGGAMVILLHKLEKWRNMRLLHLFNKFSNVQLFKPKRSHALRSSFYMIASDVQPQSHHATEAVDSWKKVWTAATFGPPEPENHSEKDAQDVLDSFGEQYLRLGTPIWLIQKNALEKSSFCR